MRAPALKDHHLGYGHARSHIVRRSLEQTEGLDEDRRLSVGICSGRTVENGGKSRGWLTHWDHDNVRAPQNCRSEQPCGGPFVYHLEWPRWVLCLGEGERFHLRLRNEKGSRNTRKYQDQTSLLSLRDLKVRTHSATADF